MVGQMLRKGMGIVSALVLAAAIPVGVQAQAGTLTGTITDESTGGPLSTVQVFLQGTSRGGLSGPDGRFTLTDVPPGNYTLIANRIGYQEARQTDISVAAGQVTTVNIAMSGQVLQLQEIVATGLIDPVEGTRSPISVARISRDVMPVAVAGPAIQNIQGRVAGATVNRGSGQPGSEPSIMLRSPTSLRGSGAPLVVVDGVILGGVLSDANTTAIEGMDIESIEIIRGAAASSLYGSRAAAGVIAITTARGQGLAPGRTQFSARTEYGVTQAFKIDDLPRHHHYLVNPAGTAYVNAQGVEVPRAQRVPMSNSAYLQFMENPYPGPVFDNVGAVLQPGDFQAHNFTVMQNTESTNFAASLSRTAEEGALAGNRGYYRNSFRLNLDHRFLNTLNMGVSMSHARDGRENIATGSNATAAAFSGTGLFTTMLQAPRDIDLSVRDANGNYVQQPDPDVAFENPLWTASTRSSDMQGNRTILSSDLGWRPFPWLTGSGRVSYDRREQMTSNLVPKGTPLSVGQEGESDGSIAFNGLWTDTWNAEGQVSLRRDFGRHDARVTFRGLMERDRTELGNRQGENFTLFGVPHISAIAPQDRRSTSSEREVRALGYLTDLAFSFFDGRYTATVLGRRDGSSLFGADARWRNYYRVAGAWIMSEEEWFNLPNVNNFKLSYARGTAGGRPGWDAQYETWNLVDGIPNKGTGQLGNRLLRPEHTMEQEVSLNMIIQNRFGVELTHAWQRTEDQIVPAPLPSFIGYPQQWVNAGTVTGHSTEFTLEAQMVQRPNLGWTSLFVADYSDATIKEWPLPCNAVRTWRFDCPGEPVYGIYGHRLLTNLGELQTHLGGGSLQYADQFQVNDEGYVVWVGDKNYTDGIVNGEVQPGTWGTASPNLGGQVYQWGVPFFERDETGALLRPSLGKGNAVNLGWINNLRWNNFGFHAQLHASIGGVANNRAFQDMITSSRNFPGLDQAGRPDGLKKPWGYYNDAVGSGGSTYITEKADYLKLRTLSVNYRFSQPQFQRLGLDRMGMTGLQIGLTGRNIFTLTGYSGFDPEQALDLNNRLNAVTTGTYPSTRTFTAEASVTF
jgi:TonB-linked SusC/RagA family outer membrane protein